MHQAREDAILQSACRLLGEKAFDAMTMDDVANAVGIAKASLYKHFCSKEELCSAAMVQILGRVQTYLAGLPADMPPLEKLHALVRWSLERLLTNEMPLLPSRNSTLRAVLMANKDYLNGLVAVSDQIGEWITQGRQFVSPYPPVIGAGGGEQGPGRGLAHQAHHHHADDGPAFAARPCLRNDLGSAGTAGGRPAGRTAGGLADRRVARFGLPAARRAKLHERGTPAARAAEAAAAAGSGHQAADDDRQAEESRHDELSTAGGPGRVRKGREASSPTTPGEP